MAAEPKPGKNRYFNLNNFTLKKLLLFTLLFSALSSVAQNHSNIEFVENKGQWDSRVQYKGIVDGGAFFIRQGGFTVLQHNPQDLAMVARFLHGQNQQGEPVKATDRIVLRSHAYHVDFLGANPVAKNAPDKSLPTYNNYFIGNDPSKWAGDCHIFQTISVQNLYPGIDMRYYTDNGFLKYDLIAAPGADISKIAFKYTGADRVVVRNKELVVATSVGELKEAYPYTYQAEDKGRREVNCKYVVKDNVVRFDIRDYDRTKTLVIDPTLIFCSFSGSTADNWGFTATYGPDGAMYGGGIVFDNGAFPTSPGAFQTIFQGGSTAGSDTGPIDIGIIKLTPSGNNRVYATYIGGSGNEQPHSLVVNSAGELILAGRTSSTNYPIITPAGQYGQGGGFDIVVTKLNATGTGLIGSRKIGGTGDDGVNISVTRGLQSLQRNYGDDGRSEVILDAAGNIYVASSTQSTAGAVNTQFPVTANAFQKTAGGNQDGVVIKLDPSLNTVLFSSFLGGSDNDAAYVLSLSPAGNIYVAGGTESADLFHGSEVGALQPAYKGSIDGYVTEITNNGNTVLHSTYLGTIDVDQVFGVQFDAHGYPYVMGQTTGDWPVVNAPYSNANSKQFIAKLEPDLSAWVYSTVFGTGSATPNISPIAFLVDKCENVYISGWGGFFFNSNGFNSATTNGLPVTPDAIKSTTDGKDLYFFVLKRDAQGQLYGSFFGETNSIAQGGCDHVDGGTSRFDKNGVIYQAICGNCKLGSPVILPNSTTPGAWSTQNNSPNCNLTMVKIALNLAGVGAGVQSAIGGVPRDTAGCLPLTVTFVDTVRNAVSYEWNFGDGSPTVPTNNFSISHTYNTVGIFRVMLVAIDPNTCNVRDTSYLNIKVGDLIANLAFNPVKLLPCDQFKYRFDNNSVAPPSKPFTAQSFIWDFGDGSPRVVSGPAPVFHNYAGPGSYTVKLILPDTSYCNAPDSITQVVRVASLVKAQFKTPPIGCAPYKAVFENTSQAGQSFEWNFGDGGTSTATSPTHTYNLAGTYIVTLVANDPNTCNLTDTTRFTINVFNNPTAAFTYSPNPVPDNIPITFTNNSSADAVQFKWEFGDGDTLRTASRLPIQHQFNKTGTFQTCLTAYNAAGCADSTCQQVKITIIPLVDVPNAFTPNSGNENAVLKVRGFGIAKMKFIIWNRWGQKVFESASRFDGWDGKVKGVLQPMDVYAYTLEVEFFDGTKASRKGDITLIR